MSYIKEQTIMKQVKRAIIYAAIVVFLAAAFSGCTDSVKIDSSNSGTVSPSVEFEYTASDPVRHYTPEGGCYYVSDIDVKNKGSVAAENVMVRCSLKTTGSGSISDTKSEFFEVIDAGDHKGFTLKFDGGCDGSYIVEVKITEDYR